MFSCKLVANSLHYGYTYQYHLHRKQMRHQAVSPICMLLTCQQHFDIRLMSCVDLQIEKFLSKEVAVMQWVALAAFLIQLLSVMLACWLTSVQKAELEAAET